MFCEYNVSLACSVNYFQICIIYAENTLSNLTIRLLISLLAWKWQSTFKHFFKGGELNGGGSLREGGGI